MRPAVLPVTLTVTRRLTPSSDFVGSPFRRWRRCGNDRSVQGVRQEGSELSQRRHARDATRDHVIDAAEHESR
jgi:hypothetical protein